MTSQVAPSPAPPLRLQLDAVNRLRVHLAYRDVPEGPADVHCLLDVPLPDREEQDTRFDEEPFLEALQPVVLLGDSNARHYSLHVHRWRTSWGPSTGALEIGVTVTTGRHAERMPRATDDAARAGFRALLALTDRPLPAVASRDDAVRRARQSLAAVHGLDAATIAITSEQRHADTGAWSLGLRTSPEEQHAVVVGFVDGYAGSVRLRPVVREVHDSVGVE